MPIFQYIISQYSIGLVLSSLTLVRWTLTDRAGLLKLIYHIHRGLLLIAPEFVAIMVLNIPRKAPSLDIRVQFYLLLSSL